MEARNGQQKPVDVASGQCSRAQLDDHEHEAQRGRDSEEEPERGGS